MKRYHISKLAEPYIHEILYDVIYHYITGYNFQRYADSLRGSLGLCYRLRLCSTDFFIFLTNFLVWLENKNGFPENESDTFQVFYDGFVEDLQNSRRYQ